MGHGNVLKNERGYVRILNVGSGIRSRQWRQKAKLRREVGAQDRYVLPLQPPKPEKQRRKGYIPGYDGELSFKTSQTGMAATSSEGDVGVTVFEVFKRRPARSAAQAGSNTMQPSSQVMTAIPAVMVNPLSGKDLIDKQQLGMQATLRNSQIKYTPPMQEVTVDPENSNDLIGPREKINPLEPLPTHEPADFQSNFRTWRPDEDYRLTRSFKAPDRIWEKESALDKQGRRNYVRPNVALDQDQSTMVNTSLHNFMVELAKRGSATVPSTVTQASFDPP
jgi:hypothetical protein